MTTIRIEKLKFGYSDKKEVLKGVNLFVDKSEKVALIGPNGSGKSTLLLHLNGILKGEGKIFIGERELSNSNLNLIRRTVGIIFQDPNDQLFCPTVYDDIAFGPLHFGLMENELDKVIKSALRITDTEYLSNRQPHHLSIGERRRASIAAVLSCNPSILAFDEPAASLDPKHKRNLIDFINKDDRTMIIATHDLELASKTCTKAALLYDGKIVDMRPAKELISDTSTLIKYGL